MIDICHTGMHGESLELYLDVKLINVGTLSNTHRHHSLTVALVGSILS